MNALTEYLGISKQFADTFEQLEIEWCPDYGPDGHTITSYVFFVPQNTPVALMEDMDWLAGLRIGPVPVTVMVAAGYTGTCAISAGGSVNSAIA